MSERTYNDIEMNFKLLREALWNLEDKLTTIMDSLADHEADLVRLRRQIALIERQPRDSSIATGGSQHA